MTSLSKTYVNYNGQLVPRITGAGGGGKGGGGGGISEDPNSLFSTDILFVTIGLGEGPVYRINPNGPQDIEIQDGAIDDLIILDGDGSEDTEQFKTLTNTGTTTQSPLRVFGETITAPQNFKSPVSLKKGNVDGIPAAKVTLQDTSANDWDSIKFGFILQGLTRTDDDGNIHGHQVSIKITVFDRIGTTEIASISKTVDGKTNVPFKFTVRVNIPEQFKSTDGYKFTIEKTSDDTESSLINENIQSFGWFEIENSPQSYPRTAHIGYALKATNEHKGGIPNFTSMVKGLLVKVPSNYNQPILANGEIDWRELELEETGSNGYTTNGYRLQKSGTGTILTDANPQLYVGTWDGTFVYSWTQNPVWIVYDILTNKTYGLGVPEENVDKFKFFQIAQYCDACDVTTGEFQGVNGQADGSFRHKPLGKFTSVRETLIGVPAGTVVKERRFMCDITISDQEQSMDILNTICASFRGALVYTLGKLSLAVDMPDEFPMMIFNETNIQTGSFQISGTKESEIITGADVSYLEPTNHYKRETVRIDTVDANDGNDRNTIENIATIDLPSVTRRSQALRFAQYQIAASRYQRRTINFVTSTDSLSLSPGDLVSVSQNMTGINFGYGGKIHANASTDSNSANILLEHFTEPTLASSTFTANSDPLALRIISLDSDRIDLYVIDNAAFTLTSTDNVSTGFDLANVSVVGRFNPITKAIDSYTTFTSNNVPKKGDLWSLGEWQNPGDFYTNKSGKLFKLTDISRDPEKEEITIGAIEYISNIYVDSDTFIDYTPTPYTDIISTLSTPPTPEFNFSTRAVRTYDGSIRTDGVVEINTEREDFNQLFKTEFFIAQPEGSTLLNNVTAQNPLTFTSENNSVTIDGASPVSITGKNGFSGFAGELRMLCTDVTVVDTDDGSSGNVQFTIRGLNDAFDENFNKHILSVNDASFAGLKGFDGIRFPVNQKSSQNSKRNFVAFGGVETEISANALAFDTSTNTLKIDNFTTGSQTIFDRMPSAPFFVKLDQLLDARFYANLSFYVSGTEKTFIDSGSLSEGLNTINLPVKSDSANFIRFFSDGIEKTAGQFIYNKNESLESANIQYTAHNENIYRVEIDHYTVPTIEVGDNVQVSFNNTFSVINTSYDTDSAEYNASATANSIFRIYLATKPKTNLASKVFTNISKNPVGVINNVSGSTFTFDYDTTRFPGSFNLTNNKLYTITINNEFDKITLPQDRIIKDLPLGITSLRARNRNPLGRFSNFSEKSVVVETLPIQKITNDLVTESLYREQNSGVSVRVTLSFDHITDQEVTDYEISYKLDNVADVGADDGGADLTSFNTVKVPALGVDSDGKIRFTVTGINRGVTSESNSITFRVTPLNKNIRGTTKTISKTIIGKTAKPANIFNLTGGQQSDQVTLFWEYTRNSETNELVDLDLKEVIITRVPGELDATESNFLAGTPFVTVAAGVNRKSVPIDTFGTFTYLAKTRDTSGNFSESVVKVTLTTTRPQGTTVVAAFNEDNPSENFTDITNTNAGETNFPSFANSNTGGLSFDFTSLVDNANGTSQGFSVVAGEATDLLADEEATYITQVRDFGVIVNGIINVDIEGTQVTQLTYFDQHEHVVESVTETAPLGNVLYDSSFGGIGHLVGFSNTAVVNPRFDANNKTLVSGSASGASSKVFGIHLHGNFTNDTSNANVFALIAGSINANAVALGETFFANGEPTGGNTYANIAVAGTSYLLVDFNQYDDGGSTETYVGSFGGLTSQTLIRTSTEDDVFFANGNVNLSAFVGSEVNEGFVPYEAGSRSFRHFQLKFVVNNSKPDELDFTIDKFRYTIEKEQSIFEDTVTYNANPTTVDYSSFSYKNRPVINLQPIDTATAQTAVVTAGSNSSVSFRLFDLEAGTNAPTDQSIQVQVSATGV